jgi:hypothetical protein
MAIVCVAGATQEIGKTAVAEFLLGRFPGWSAARIRVADELSQADTAALADADHRLLSVTAANADAESARLLAAGAREVMLLLAQPRGLAAGLKAMLARMPADADAVIEGNAFLWGHDADVAIMVIGPGPSGKGLSRVRGSVRELFAKINIWAWNSRRDPGEEGFFDFPIALAKMGFKQAVSNQAEYHHVNPREDGHSGNAPFADAVRQAMERKHWRRGSDEFLRKAGFNT